MNLHRRFKTELIIVPKRIPGLSATTLQRFVLKARHAVRLRGRVDVLIAGNRELRSLNRQFRKKDKATDVLSFPAPQDFSSGSGRFAGELAISVEIAKENAERLGHSLAEEIKILTLHGILHLAGFDHEHDGGEMERREAVLRRRLKLSTGLIERTNRSSLRRRRA